MKQIKLTVATILDLYADCKTRYEESGIYRQWEEDERFYELNFLEDLDLPEGFEGEGVILPTGRDMVDINTDHTDIFNVRVSVNKRGESQKSEDEMNLLRKFGLGVLYRNSVEASIAPIRVVDKHVWIYGLGIFKDVWDADKYADKPEQKGGESEDAYAERIDEWRAETHDSIPIVIQGINPRNIMLDPYYDGGMFVFETRDELCYNVREKFGKWGNPLGRKDSEKVEHISFWTKDYRCELYDKEPVMKGGVVKHTYGFIPYVPIDSGLGNISSDNDLKKRYVGILRFVRDLLISESRDFSLGDVILKQNAFPWGWLEGDNAQATTDVHRKYGEWKALPPGVKPVNMTPQLPPDALLSWLGVSANYLAAHGAQNVLRGMGEPGVRAAAQYRNMIAEASTKYQYTNEAFKNGVAKVLSNCARIMKNVVPGDINVWAKTPTDEFDIEIKKDKMKEPFTFYVEFSSISEEDEYRRHSDLISLVQSGLAPIQWARKQMTNMDWQAMELEDEVQRMKLDPAVQQVISQYLSGRLMEAMTKRSTAESITNPPPIIPNMGISMPQMGMGGAQSPTPPGGRLTTQIPSMPIPGSPQDIANKMKTVTQGIGGGGNRL